MLFNTPKISLSLTILLALAMFVSAMPLQAGYGKGERKKGPPPQAIEACADLLEGDVCSFSGRRDRIVEGFCIVPKMDETTLACAPEHGKHSKKEHTG